LLRKVLFFRDQSLTTDQHVALARRFGELEVHPFTAGKEGYDEVLMVDHGPESPSNENYYHSDVSWRADPSMGSILYCRETPEFGGDTIFVDMYAAYEGLPDDVKDRIRGATATHDWHNFRLALMANSTWTEQQIKDAMIAYPEQHHPVVRTHPETGRDLLYVNPIFTKCIDGMSPQDSDELLQRLYQQAPAPEFQVRFSWKAGSVAFWDNRAVQHYAVADYWPQRRIMERVTILGDKPFFREKAKL
jgi:taurine dioxygenase